MGQIPPPSYDEPPSDAMNREDSPMVMPGRQVEITNLLGLHLRAADKFGRLAQQFRADIQVAFEGRTVSGRSILDLMMLAAPRSSRLKLRTDGPDAEAALEALTSLIGRRFDEAE